VWVNHKIKNSSSQFGSPRILVGYLFFFFFLINVNCYNYIGNIYCSLNKYILKNEFLCFFPLRKILIK
jgi:hypothetical protein